MCCKNVLTLVSVGSSSAYKVSTCEFMKCTNYRPPVPAELNNFADNALNVLHKPFLHLDQQAGSVRATCAQWHGATPDNYTAPAEKPRNNGRQCAPLLPPTVDNVLHSSHQRQRMCSTPPTNGRECALLLPPTVDNVLHSSHQRQTMCSTPPINVRECALLLPQTVDNVLHSSYQRQTMCSNPPINGRQCAPLLPPTVDNVLYSSHQRQTMSSTPHINGRQCAPLLPPTYNSLFPLPHY